MSFDPRKAKLAIAPHAAALCAYSRQVREWRARFRPLEDFERTLWPTNTPRRERMTELLRANRLRRYGPVKIDSFAGAFAHYAKGIAETLHQSSRVAFWRRYGYDPTVDKNRLLP